VIIPVVIAVIAGVPADADSGGRGPATSRFCTVDFDTENPWRASRSAYWRHPTWVGDRQRQQRLYDRGDNR